MKLKLLILSLFSLGLCLLINTPTAFAQNSTPSATPLASSPSTQAAGSKYLNTNPDVPTNLHTHTQSVFIEIASAISCVLTGTDPTQPESKCLGIDPTSRKIGYIEGGGGAIGITGDLIAGTFYLPVNTGQYIQSVASNFGFVKETQAQSVGGIGFNSLLPTLKMWTAFRNITYMLFTLIFIIVGLGIMFRIKLDPRTVMTIQNQIPRIILALVFVTFSYALAGFLIDLMYVSIYLVIAVFRQQGFDTVNATASTPFTALGGGGYGGTGLGGISGIASGVSGAMAGMVKDIFTGTIGNIVGGIIGGLIGKMVGGGSGPIGTITTAVGAVAGFAGSGTVIKYTAWIITYLVVVIAIFSALLRLWFVLLKSYLYIFLTVVFAPFYIAMGVMPGKSGIGAWLRGMLANLAVFPTTIVMFMLGKAFMDGFATTSANPGADATPFVPPLIGGFADPERMAAIIGLAIILLTPEVANMIKDALKVTDLKYAAAIGKGLGAGAGVLGAPLSTIGGKAWGIDPYNKQPRPLTKWVQDKVGQGNNMGGKVARFLLGTGKYHSETPAGEKAAERDNKIKSEKERLKGLGMKPPSSGQIGRIVDWNSGDLQKRPKGLEGPEPPSAPTPTTPTGGGPTGGGTPTGTDAAPEPTSDGDPTTTTATGTHTPGSDSPHDDEAMRATHGTIEPSDPGTPEEATRYMDEREKFAENMREGLGNQGLNENSISQVLRNHFAEEVLTKNVEDLKKLAEEQRKLMQEEKRDNEKSRIQHRLMGIEEKIKRLQGRAKS